MGTTAVPACRLRRIVVDSFDVGASQLVNARLSVVRMDEPPLSTGVASRAKATRSETMTPPAVKPHLVSVILPNRNHAHFLERQVRSLLAQSRAELQICIVDDASSDDSRALIAGLAEEAPRIRYKFLDRHSGINEAVRAGLAMARGDYLYFAAADDWIEPTFFEVMVGALELHPWAGLCFSDPTTVDMDGRTVPLRLHLAPGEAAFRPDRIVRLLRQRPFHISSNTVLYRRSQFEEVGGYRPDLAILSDWFLNYALALRYGAVYLPVRLTWLTVRSDSQSVVSLKNDAEHAAAVTAVLATLDRPEFGDLRPRFQTALLLPEYRWRDIRLLRRHPGDGQWLSAAMVVRILLLGLWHYVRPFSPMAVRTVLRRLFSPRGY